MDIGSKVILTLAALNSVIGFIQDWPKDSAFQRALTLIAGPGCILACITMWSVS